MTCEEIWLVKPTLELEKEALKYRQEHFDFWGTSNQWE